MVVVMTVGAIKGWVWRLVHIHGAVGPCGAPWAWAEAQRLRLPASPVYGDIFHVALGPVWLFSFPKYLQDVGSSGRSPLNQELIVTYLLMFSL